MSPPGDARGRGTGNAFSLYCGRLCLEYLGRPLERQRGRLDGLRLGAHCCGVWSSTSTKLSIGGEQTSAKPGVELGLPAPCLFEDLGQAW